MFVSSQLVEISQRFQPDVADLQVLLQEEGLPVRSPECLEQLSARLNSDPRFHRDLAFLVRSMLFREPDEPGSLDVLGVLVVAAAGTRQQFDTAPVQARLRELLRFVMQQRRTNPPASPAAVERAAAVDPRLVIPAPVARAPITPDPLSPRLTIQPEPPSPAQAAVATPAARAAVPRHRDAQVRSIPDAMPSLAGIEPQPIPRRTYALGPLAVLLLIISIGVGLVLHRDASKAVASTGTPMATVPPAPADPPIAEPERPAVPPPARQLNHAARRPSRSALHATSRRAGRRQASAPDTVANTSPQPLESHQPTQSGPQASPQPAPPTPKLAQPVIPNPVQQPIPQHRDSAAVTPPAAPASRPSGPPAGGNVFAHPEAAAAGTPSQPPAFHPKDPVLIARNAPVTIPGKSEIQGTVHTGSTGTMASNLMYSPEPEYPAGAIAAGVEGEVTIRAVVGPRGNVIDERVVSGPPQLRDAALEAVSRWRYRPYEQDGKPVAIATTAILDFQAPPRK